MNICKIPGIGLIIGMEEMHCLIHGIIVMI